MEFCLHHMPITTYTFSHFSGWRRGAAAKLNKISFVALAIAHLECGLRFELALSRKKLFWVKYCHFCGTNLKLWRSLEQSLGNFLTNFFHIQKPYTILNHPWTFHSNRSKLTCGVLFGHLATAGQWLVTGKNWCQIWTWHKKLTLIHVPHHGVLIILLPL